MRIKYPDTNITTAFKALRKNGIYARQNLMCCSSCAWAEIESMPKEKLEKYRGYTFYHGQDNADLKNRGECYLTFSAAENADGNVDDRDTVVIGKEIVKTLNSFNVKTEWDGTSSHRIKIFYS